nr:GNAT family N-acetyltransferase [Defluviimonas salinarum]
MAEDRGFVAGLLASHEVLVARANWVVGFLARQGGEIDALYVAATARGRGVGSALLAAAGAAESDLSLWTFQANAGALRFYSARGFVETERTDGSGNAERLPDVRLVRKAGGAA